MGAKKGVVGLSADAEILRDKLTGLLRWEKRKRWEQIAAEVLCYSLLGALLLMPLYPLLADPVHRWFIPLIFVSGLAPVFWLRRCWRSRDAARALARLDKALSLDERALTAWEILRRNDTRAPALLVLREAQNKLEAFYPRRLFARHWSWQALTLLPLLAIWSGLVWFDFSGSLTGEVSTLAASSTLAQKLREYARELQQKAENEGLKESLEVGRELEKMAQQGIESRTADDRFRAELPDMAKKLEAVAKSAAEPSSFAAESQQNLKDLKAELEAAQDLFNFPDSVQQPRELSQSWLDRLTAMPQLRRQLDRSDQAGQSMARSEVLSFLDKLARQVTGELDRRSVLDAQQFLEQLMKQGQGEKGETQTRTARSGEKDLAGEGEREKSRSSLPGKEPGKKEEGEPSLPEAQGGAPTHLKGLLGEGQSGALVFRGKPSGAKSEILSEEVVASYRRQAEAELNTERVPAALRDAIRKYFLSLDAEQGK
jgi:hypothetical protein